MPSELQQPAAAVEAAPPARAGTDGRPSILVLTYISPTQKWGSAKRSRFLIEALQCHGDVEVLVITFVDRADGVAPFTTTLWQGVKVMELRVVRRGLLGRARFDLPSAHVSAEVAQHVDLSRYDLLVSRYVKPALKLHLPPDVPLLVDFDDAVYEPPWRALHGLRNWGGAFLRLFNDRCIVRGRLRLPQWRKAHYFFCRDAEREAFGGVPGSVLPNLPPAADGAGPPDFTPPAAPALMFVGLLDYMPNHDAVDWFIDAVWPQVLQAVPQASFLVVGSGSPERLARWALAPRVETLGFVDSLSAAYARATACVVPMRSGAGTNIKALEPYLYGRMVIATPLVAEGHRPLFTHGKDILVAGDAAGLARHCIDMLRAPGRASDIARQGHARITGTLTQARFRAVVDAALRPRLPQRRAAGPMATAQCPRGGR